METKLFEIRDSMTFLVVSATLIGIGDEQSNDAPAMKRESWLLWRTGWKPGTVVVTRIGNRIETEWDPHVWQERTGTRTVRIAHEYIVKHWDELRSGDLICVETILGQRAKPKDTEQSLAPDYGQHPKAPALP